MLKKTITYEDFDGNQRKEDFWFGLSQPEIVELEASSEGGLEKDLRKIMETQDTKKILEIFKKIIIMAYGEKSADGRRFIKTEEVKANFLETNAYNQLYMELIQDEDAAIKFITGIMPKGVDIEEAKKQMAVEKQKLLSEN